MTTRRVNGKDMPVCDSCGGTVCTVPGCKATEAAFERMMVKTRERWAKTDWTEAEAKARAGATAKAKKYGMA